MMENFTNKHSYNYVDELTKNKKVTEADRKFVEKIIAKHINPTATRIRNPISHWEGDCTPLVAALVVFIYSLDLNNFSERSLNKYGVSEGGKIIAFDRARMLVLKLNLEVYMNVVD